MEHSAGNNIGKDAREVLLGRMERRARLEASAIRERKYGGIINLLSEVSDSDEGSALGIVRDELGVEATDVRNINIEDVVVMLETGIKEYTLEISEEIIDRQTLFENIFSVVYHGFGKDGKGWRIGLSSMLDDIRKFVDKNKTSLVGTPFEGFLKTLNLDLGEDNSDAPRLIVLHYPQLDLERKLEKADDADPENIESVTAERISKYAHIFSLINQVYPNKFQKDNPAGHVVVNVIDSSYRWFFGRDKQLQSAYRFIRVNDIETPEARVRDEKLFETLDGKNGN